MNVIFYISAAVALFSTVMVITRLNAIHALIYLIVSLLAVAVIFFTLGAAFAAALEVIIYAGAIMVLFVFAVMLLNLGHRSAERERQWRNPKAWIGPGILAALLIAELVVIIARGTSQLHGMGKAPPKLVGVTLFGPYVLGVELASMLLLAGMVGAYHLGRRERNGKKGEL